MLYGFGDFELDTQRFELRRAGVPQSLEPQGFNVLLYLIEQRDRVVSKDELLEQLWPNQNVTEATLTQRLVAARRALGDSGRTQRYIRTIHGRGYRFIEAVTVRSAAVPSAPVPGAELPATSLPLTPEPPPAAPVAPVAPARRLSADLIGRDTELATLHTCFAQALQGQRQLVFLTGEAGIGKTTLADAFVEQVQTTTAVWVGRGQCVEHYGAGEAYLPLLEVLGRLGRGPGRSQLSTALQQQAPSWLVHLPALLPADDYMRLQQQAGSFTRARMLRELAEAIEGVTATQALLIVLEDLHWSDVSTVEWLTYVAQRRDPAKLMIIGTYRPSDALVRNHPIHIAVQELQRRSQSLLLPVPYWSLVDTTTYLTRRLGPVPFAFEGIHLLHQRTQGHPFFLVTMVETMVPHHLPGGSLQDADAWPLQAPESVRRLIEAQIERLTPDEQALLETASVAGESFSTATLAAGLDQSIDAVETRCAALARKGQFIRSLGVETWPDATVATRYRFLHALYHEVLYERLSAGRRLRLHQRIGLQKERAYGARAAEIAAELAVHFERGQEPQRSVQYLHAAADNAMQRRAYQEAITQLRLGLELLPKLADVAAQTRWEITLQLLLARILHITRGSWTSEVGQAYARAHALSQALGPVPERITALVGLWFFYSNRAMMRRAQELGEELLSLMQAQAEPPYLAEAHLAVANPAFFMGQFALARQHFEAGLHCYAARPAAVETLIYGQNPEVQHRALLSRNLWFLGYADQARQQSQQARQRANALAQPSSQALALYHSVSLYRYCQDIESMIQHADALMALAIEHNFRHWVQASLVELGWAQVARGYHAEGLGRMQQGVTELMAMGAEIFRPAFLLLLADASLHAGHLDEAERYLAQVQEAMVTSEARSVEAESWRLQGDLCMRLPTPDVIQAEARWQQALAVAQHQQARALELRAVLRLGRLWQQQGRREAARTLLAEIYEWFTEGFDTVDLQQARLLLTELDA